jgi:hypothetical protein
MSVILDEYDLREMPPGERLDKIKELLKNEGVNLYDGMQYGLQEK